MVKKTGGVLSVSVRACVRVSARACMRVSARACVLACVYVCMCLSTRVHARARVCVCVCACMQTCRRARMYVPFSFVRALVGLILLLPCNKSRKKAWFERSSSH